MFADTEGKGQKSAAISCEGIISHVIISMQHYQQTPST